MKFGILIAATALLGAVTATSADRRGAEPIGRYQLSIDGAEVELVLDRATTVEVDGESINLLLKAPKTRLFDTRGIRFEFPAGMQFRHDGSTPSFDNWNLTGTDAVIMVHQYEGQPRDAVRALLKDGLLAEFEAMGAEVTESVATLRIVGAEPQEVEGTALNIKLGAVYLMQEVYTFESLHGGVALILQDNRERMGSATAEFVDVRDLLKSTLRIAE